MIQRKSWSQLEDRILVEILRESSQKGKQVKADWAKVTELLNSRLDLPRKAKQCRERWSKHLKPGLSKESEWSMAEQTVVCTLQAQHGNRWSLIAAQLPGRTDNAVKNYFYSSLRKALRKINHYITENRHLEVCRGIKVISETTIGKVVALAEGKPGRMRVLAEDITQLAKDIKRDLLSLWQGGYADAQIEETISKLLHFNRNCRRVRGPTKLNRVDRSEESEEEVGSVSEQFASAEGCSGGVSSSHKSGSSIINTVNNKLKLQTDEFCRGRKESTDDPREDVCNQEMESHGGSEEKQRDGRISLKDDCWDAGRYASQVGNVMLLSREYREEERSYQELVRRPSEISQIGKDGQEDKEGSRTGLFNYQRDEANDVKASMLRLFRQIDPQPRFASFQNIYWGEHGNEDEFDIFSMPQEEF